MLILFTVATPVLTRPGHRPVSWPGPVEPQRLGGIGDELGDLAAESGNGRLAEE